ncbi:hypothetical protein GIB67_037103 [Kingdonia uniflora]|uniref:Uncharacterized protein n=1 Tax=Kingdonia uniflora TaxID=39325 RepID=A0A7J7LHS0_9MAGN|nr:hypothetical protein GIB67_037103 [Kingdonia uniflora]
MQIIKTLVGISLLTWISMVSSSDPPTAYEMLEKFNFPKGILPLGVKSYTLHEDNRFEVYLNGDCKFEIENGGYSLNYKKKISGKVVFGDLRELQGVSVKILFVWVSIGEVRNRGDGKMEFYVGPLSASFPVSNFEDCPQCDCKNRDYTNQMVLDS